MKIIAVSHEYPPIGGGGANACMYLLKLMAAKGHDITLVTVGFGEYEPDEICDEVRIIRLPAKRSHKEHCSFKEMLNYLWVAAPVVNKLQREENFDLCYVFFGIPSGPLGLMLKLRYKVPYVIRFGGGDIPGFQDRFTKVYKLIAPAIKYIWKKADALVANSEGLRQMAYKFCDKYEFKVIPNGVDTGIFKPANQEGKVQIEAQASDEIRVLFVSRLIERKGVQFVIPQIKDIENKTGKKVRFTVVGDGPYRTELEKIAADNGVSDRIHFVGQKDKSEIVAYYQDADMFILPSAKEGMPNVVLEAMAAGLPIIMTPCQGSDELIDGNGIITAREEFGAAITDLALNDEKRLEMAKMSRKRACEIFSWEATAESYLDIFAELKK